MSIPDKVSHDDLKKLLEVPDDKPELDDNEPLFDGYTTGELIDLCHEAKNALAAKCKHPMAHKALALLIIEHFIEFHANVAGQHQSEGCDRSLVWAKDVGTLESVRRLLADVCLSHNDWFVGWDFESDVCPDSSDDS